MASENQFLRPPASMLNDDTLYHIFFLNTLRKFNFPEYGPPKDEIDIDNMPSTITRRSSQVCSQWRRVLLRASVIWGRCIDVDVLGISTEWRDEVLRRAGNAPVAIRHQYRDFKHYVGDEYLAQLLAATWPRVMELDIPYEEQQFKLIIPQLNLPAPNMESFVLGGHNITMPEEMNINLFQGYAPKLANIRMPRHKRLTYNPVSMLWKSPTLFTINMRFMHLDNDTEIPPSILLQACMRMPLLEVLHVRITQEDDPPPYFPPDQQVVLAMNHLKYLHIGCPTFDVYETFISRISTAPGCFLGLTHPIRNGNHKFVRYTELMKQMFSKFSESLYDNAPRTEVYSKVLFELAGLGPFFSAYNQTIWLQITSIYGASRSGLAVDPLYVPAAIDAFLALKMPSDSMSLQLNFSDKHHNRWINSLPREIHTQLKSSFQRLLGPGSMPWATSLHITHRDLFLIHKIYRADTVFPHLQHLFLRGRHMHRHMHMETVVLPFVANRRETMMTVNFDLLSESPVRHVRAFGRERLPEALVFVWNKTERLSLAEYVEDEHPDDENVVYESSADISASASTDTNGDTDDNPDDDSD